MGALYEDVENFFGDIFAWYGRKVARRPLVFVLVPLITCCMLGLGLFNIEYETDLENLYTPVNSRALRDRKLLREAFDGRSGVAGNQFYPHQAVDRPDYVELIVRARGRQRHAEMMVSADEGNDDEEQQGDDYFQHEQTQHNGSVNGTDDHHQGEPVDVLSEVAIDEVRRLFNLLIFNITPHYDQVCARRKGVCVIDGITFLFQNQSFSTNMSSLSSPSSSSSEIPADSTTSAHELHDRPKASRCIHTNDATAISDAMKSGLSFTTAYQVDVIRRNAADNDRQSMEPEQLVASWKQTQGPNSRPHPNWQDERYDGNHGLECLRGLALKLRFHLDASDTVSRQRSVLWQDAFIETMKVYQSDVIDVAFVAADSLQIELRDHVGDDTKYLTISIVAMLVLATVTGCSCRAGGDRAACIIGHVTLAYAGVVAALLSILGAYGLLSLLGSRFVNLSSVMPFLVLGIGADDMFQLMTEWQTSDRRDSTETRLSNTLRSAAVSITITSLTDLLAFCIGATSPFLSVRNFCACSGVAILLCYVNQLTFFSGCMVLHSRIRMTSSCSTTPPSAGGESSCSCDEQSGHAESGASATRTCARPPIGRGADTGRKFSTAAAGIVERGVCRLVSQFFRRFYPRGLLHWIGKCLVIVLFVIYFGLSMYGVANVEESFRLESVIPPESYYTKHLQVDQEYFWNHGLHVTFAVMEPVEYHRVALQRNISSFLRHDVMTSPLIVNGSIISWLERMNFLGGHSAKYWSSTIVCAVCVLLCPVFIIAVHLGNKDAYIAYKRAPSANESRPQPSSRNTQSSSFPFGSHQRQQPQTKRVASVQPVTAAGSFIADLRDGPFFDDNPQYRNDVAFSTDGRSIIMSRFYVSALRPNGSAAEAELMLEMRRLASGSAFEPRMLAYSPEFVFYERYASVMKNTLLPVGVTMIGMLFVALVFIPHPIPVACVTVSMVSVVVGITGLMHFWGLSLSAITTIQIILGVGICVSFTVHTSHAFMTATGKNRNDRVTTALDKVSVPILNGAASSLISTLALALGNSYVFISFYKTMILVFVLGVLHSIVFLPVLLSFVGPRRTSKPRVYVGQPAQNSNHQVRRNHDYNDVVDESTTLPLRPLNDSAPTSTTATSLSSCPRQDIPIGDVTKRSTIVPGSVDARVGYDSDEDHSSIGNDFDDDCSVRRRHCLNAVSELTDTDDQEFGDCVSDATGSDDQVDHQPSVPAFGWDSSYSERSLPADCSEYSQTVDDRNTCLSNRFHGLKRSADASDVDDHSPGGARRKVSFDTIKETSGDDD